VVAAGAAGRLVLTVILLFRVTGIVTVFQSPPVFSATEAVDAIGVPSDSKPPMSVKRISSEPAETLYLNVTGS
jgi:hypothetical protein